MKTLLLLALSLLPASAVIIGVEQFDYADGSIAAKNGGTFWNWRNRTLAARTAGTSDWDNVHNTPNVASGRLVTGGAGQNAVIREYNGPGEGSTVDIDRDDGLGAINNFIGAITFQEKKVYYRITVTTGATLPDYFGLSSHDFGTERLFFGKRGGSPTFGLESIGGSGTNGTRTIDPNTTYNLVVRIDYVAGTIALFVDPDINVDETSQLSISRTFDTTFWSTAVRLAAGGGGDPVQWDNLVVATTWEDLGTVVTTATDEDNGSLNPASGTGISLREAVNHSPTGSLITFADGLNGRTCTLSTGNEIVVTKNLTIDASSLPGGLTIDGGTGMNRIFSVNSGQSLTLHGLTLTGGNGTGATDSNKGGAIYTRGSLTLKQCTLSGNAAVLGGGIYNVFGTLTLTQCTLSGNTASHSGGAISNLTTLALTQCTLSGNAANVSGGAIYDESVALSLTLNNTIVAGNSAPSSPDLVHSFSLLTSIGVNLIGDLAGSDLSVGPTVLLGDPLLAPLGDYGGPTQTMPPLPGSPAIDAASGSTRTTDQRGFPTVGFPDIGAAEYQGNTDLRLFWNNDWDGDGNAFGLEFALGSDPTLSDPNHPKNLRFTRESNGHYRLEFGHIRTTVNSPATTIVTRSTTLLPGSFTEIYRYTGPTDLSFLQNGTTGDVREDNIIEVIDGNPPPGKAFYRIEAVSP